MDSQKPVIYSLKLLVLSVKLLFITIKMQGLSLGKPQHRPEGAAIVEAVSDAHSNSSDSNTFYEEDFSSSEDGSNDGEASFAVLASVIFFS